jgi:hypothetical protein
MNRELSDLMGPAASPVRPSGKVFVACGLWLVALGAYFLFLRPAMLPEDLRYLGGSLDAIRLAAPGFERWLGHVFDVMGGFMVAAGTMTVLAAWRSRARPEGASLAALSLAGAAGVALMSATNFALGSDFRWLLLLPALLWVVGLACHVYEGTAFRTTESGTANT